MKTAAILFIALMSLYMVSGTAAAKFKSENVTGKVTSVKSADPSRGLRPTIAVTDDKGERTLFEITPATEIYGVDSKPVTLEVISKGVSVKVNGTAIMENIGEATSIRLLK